MQRKLNSVLLIDDDEATNFINEMVIEESGMVENVIKKQSATEALTFLQEKDQGGKYAQPDIIFLDINMPGMDGFEFLEEYDKLKNEQKGKVILIMLTTSVNPDDRKKAEKFNLVNNFMHKPLTEEMFEEILEKHFGMKKA